MFILMGRSFQASNKNTQSKWDIRNFIKFFISGDKTSIKTKQNQRHAADHKKVTEMEYL